MNGDHCSLDLRTLTDVGRVLVDADRLSPHAQLRLAPSRTPSIADALVLKDGDVFFLTEPNGNVPVDEGHAFGLYYHDCRFLDGYELRVAGYPLETLVSTAGRGYQSLVELTNPELVSDDGEVVARPSSFGVTWTRTLDGSGLALYETLSIRNFRHQSLSLPISLAFRAGFQDVFSVRSLVQDALGIVRPPRVDGGRLDFEYPGQDDLPRRVTIYFEQPPDSWRETEALYFVDLGPRGQKDISLVVLLAEGGTHVTIPNWEAPVAKLHHSFAAKHASAEKAWMQKRTQVRSSSLLLDSILDRSLRDLRLLRSSISGFEYFAAGVPWFATLFGRDSIISALQVIAFSPLIARETLEILACLQGTGEDAWREEQPGKILHEIRLGELARTGRVPHSPYYGTIDATPLFLVLAAEYFAWTGDRATIERLRPNMDAAVKWLNDSLDGNGYLTYQQTSSQGLFNQGWKDSDNGIPNANGRPAEPPIALVEVQAYAYLAWTRLAHMYRRLGEPERAEPLEREAASLQERFERDFWMEQRGCYALALQEGGRQARVCSSNAAHVLWSEIAAPDRARRTRKRLMSPDMFTGWGIRTLSQREQAYSPVGYHIGTVWPHDNSLAMAGFRRYGYDKAALRLFSGMMSAAMHFELYRLPELFAGFSRTDYDVPVHYPLASKPQAWAAGAIPYMLTSLLGLQPEADINRLNVRSPVLPDRVDWLELKGLKVGPHSANLRFERTPNGVAVEVQRKDQALEIIVRL